QPDERAFRFLDESGDSLDASGDGDGDEDEDEAWVSYAELDAAARQIAAMLVERGQTGRPVLLAYPPGRAYVEGFLGCLYAGAIAVPAYPPDPARLKRSLPRLRAVVADCGATVALSVSALIDAARSLTAPAHKLTVAPELAGLDWVATDAARPDPADGSTLPVVETDAPALLQYTSGSTGTPKGVVLSHANLCHNAGLVQRAFGTSPQVVGVSWLPPYHDMGLIGGILQPLYTGFPTVLMSPLTFLRRPLVWLETISRWVSAGVVTMSGGPNFAYDLCVRASSLPQRGSLDLTQWTVAFCGAEPVRARTLDRFAEAFAPAGFRREAFYPCYGLAESTLIVAGGRPGEPPRFVDTEGIRRVGCGSALGDLRVAVVDPDTARDCAPGTVGEI
ncbi:MAG: AMP-binding protein, partial [Sporichthyaceae bacterium]|nr:AMP-binding protein [Sporichthyaceae bacterium]